MSDNSDNLFDDGDEGEGTSTDSGSAAGGSESGDGKDPKSADKRISDLQSAKDKETARANKLQKQLDAIAAATKGDDAEAGKPPAQSGGGPVDSAILDMARMFAFQQNPKLAEYGISASDLNGGTPSEIAGAATELVARFEKIETQVRNKVLADQGLAPEIDAGAPPAAPRDFSKMSKEDFQKVMDAALNKR
jgi:hypothetical protein